MQPNSNTTAEDPGDFHHFHVVLYNTQTQTCLALCDFWERGQLNKATNHNRVIIPNNNTIVYLHELQHIFKQQKIKWGFLLYLSHTTKKIQLWYTDVVADLISSQQLDREAALICAYENINLNYGCLWFNSLRSGLGATELTSTDQRAEGPNDPYPPELGDQGFIQLVILEMLCKEHCWERINNRYICTTNISILQRNITYITFLIDLSQDPFGVSICHLDHDGNWKFSRELTDTNSITQVIKDMALPCPSLNNLARNKFLQVCTNFHCIKDPVIKAQMQHWHTVMKRFPTLRHHIQDIL